MEPVLLWLGLPEWGIILIIVVLLFGGTKIPALMKGLGKGISEFKKGKEEILLVYSRYAFRRNGFVRISDL